MSTGADVMVNRAVAAGVEVCFANPGTTELPFVRAMDAEPRLRPVLCLFEGVCSGAADGYARLLDRPALTLTHLGPGFANAAANLHNARRARSGVINLVGAHTRAHARHDSLLQTDLETIAGYASDWVLPVASANGCAEAMSEAVERAGQKPGSIATLLVPSDCWWESVAAPEEPLRQRPPRADAGAATAWTNQVDAVARDLRGCSRVALLLGGGALRADALELAARLSAGTGWRLLTETFPARVDRGGPAVLTRLPYFPEEARRCLAKYEHVVLVGASPPLATFGERAGESELLPAGVRLHCLAHPGEPASDALRALVEVLGIRRTSIPNSDGLPDAPRGKLDTFSLAAALIRMQPDGAIVVDESATSGGPFQQILHRARPFVHLSLTGGAIGQGPPCALGAAIAAPDQRVISLQADGGALYTLQALWSQAREGAHVTTIICANSSYRVLQFEAGRLDPRPFGSATSTLTSLDQPRIDWVSLGQGLGVPSTRVLDAEELVRALGRSFAEPGPHLIEVPL